MVAGLQTGFLNRFVVVESTEPRRVGELKRFKSPPTSIVNWVNYVRRQRGTMSDLSRDNAELDLDQIVLNFDRESEEILQDFAREIVKRQDILEKDNLEPLLSRSKEKAMRMALLCTLATNADAMTITGDVTRWAVDFIRYYDLLFIEACRDKVASSATESKIKQVLSFIRSRNGEGAYSKREVDRHELF